MIPSSTNDIILEKKQRFSTEVEDELLYTVGLFSNRQNSVNLSQNPGAR